MLESCNMIIDDQGSNSREVENNEIVLPKDLQLVEEKIEDESKSEKKKKKKRKKRILIRVVEMY